MATVLSCIIDANMQLSNIIHTKQAKVDEVVVHLRPTSQHWLKYWTASC